MKGFVTERRKAAVSWIRYLGEGLFNLLDGVEICCKEGGTSKKSVEWEENGRFYKMETSKNDAGKYLLCLAINGEGKRHKIFIPEGRGLIKGWNLLAAKLRELRIKGKVGERSEEPSTAELQALRVDGLCEKERKENLHRGRSFAEVMREEKGQAPYMIWVDAGECLQKEAMGTLKFWLVGRWENPPDTYPTALELE